ncbi:hypothetical protein GGR57DRAFT_468583 [Xylariaceae sp. FL1272]|nr:hypothetical protein GGR57DRAFT_468583 [Xylariaceae sp. FL1272]
MRMAEAHQVLLDWLSIAFTAIIPWPGDQHGEIEDRKIGRSPRQLRVRTGDVQGEQRWQHNAGLSWVEEIGDDPDDKTETITACLHPASPSCWFRHVQERDLEVDQTWTGPMWRCCHVQQQLMTPGSFSGTCLTMRRFPNMPQTSGNKPLTSWTRPVVSRRHRVTLLMMSAPFLSSLAEIHLVSDASALLDAAASGCLFPILSSSPRIDNVLRSRAFEPSTPLAALQKEATRRER